MRQSVLALVCGFWLAAAPAHADTPLGIAAVVNDAVISTLDLNRRVQLVIATTGRPPTPEVIAKARAQLIKSMIDETLRLQEAERYSILVSNEDLGNAIGAIEQQQGKPPGTLRRMIDQTGLSFESFKNQIKSQVAWRKLLARRVRRDITITDDEIARAQKRLSRGRSIPEVKLAAVIVPPQEGMDGDELLGIARDIKSQLAGGAQAATLLQAYDERIKLEFAPVTWVPRRELPPPMRDAIAQLEPGAISEPIATPAGYQILRLIDTRILRTMPTQNAEVAVKQIILQLNDNSANAEIDAKMDIARSIARYPGSCTEAGIAGLEQFDGLNIDVNYFRTTMANMSPEIRTLVEPLPVTGITQPFASDDGIHLLMLCERIAVPAPLPEADKVKAMLFDEKLQLESEKYLRKLRRDAFIDVRV